MISDIKDKVAKVINNEFNVSFYKTTIYDLWSIISSFSQILLKLYPQSELVDKTIGEFSSKLHALGMLVLDSNSLVIAQTYINDKAKDILANTTPYFLTLNDSFQGQNLESHKMVIERGGYAFYFNQFKLEKLKTAFYILIMKEKKEFPEEDIEAFIKMFRPFL
jgi:hypothetical protein